MQKGATLARSDSSPQRETSPGRRTAEAYALSDVERKILDFMVHYLRTNTYQPSIREIGERFGIKSTKTVSEHLQALASKGFLERDPSRSRGVRILGVDLAPETVSVPCYTELPTHGRGFQAEDAVLRLSVDRRLAGGQGSVFVRAAPGDLAVLGVHEGDYVLVEPVQIDEAQDGSIVVARVGDGRWFHRLIRNGTGVRLESLSPGGDTTLVEDPDRLHLLGCVTGFYRRMDERSGAAFNLTQH